jgi:hypothetical protein
MARTRRAGRFFTTLLAHSAALLSLAAVFEAGQLSIADHADRRAGAAASFRLLIPSVAADSGQRQFTADNLPFMWHFGTSLSPLDQTKIKEGLAQAAEQAAIRFGAEPPSAQVYASGDVSDLETAVRDTAVGVPTAFWDCPVCAATWYRLMFFKASPAFFESGTTEQATAHEYFHVLQDEAMGLDALRNMQTAPPSGTPPFDPIWLIEGSAEWFQMTVYSVKAPGPGAALIARRTVEAAADPTPLEAMESMDGYYASQRYYSVGPAAVQVLIHQSDPTPLLRYYTLIRQGLPWQEAFREAFGRSVSAFYGEFRAYRASLKKP